MIASRRTQPYRKTGVKRSGRAFAAMMRGRTASGYNPQDRKRAVKRAARGRGKITRY